jgi:hypothetical protein
MYCRNGVSSTDRPNTNLAVNPLFNLTKENWWFQHDRGCDAAPPELGEFLQLPANGTLIVELAHNRAFTTLSYAGKQATNWPDGKQHPEDWTGWNTEGTSAVCLREDGALHTYNESSAGGTAFAISYRSDLKDVTMENLVVFTTRYHTPWKRLATYDVPDLPACPPGGYTCAWLWIPNGCGQANMCVLFPISQLYTDVDVGTCKASNAPSPAPHPQLHRSPKPKSPCTANPSLRSASKARSKCSHGTKRTGITSRRSRGLRRIIARSVGRRRARRKIFSRSGGVLRYDLQLLLHRLRRRLLGSSRHAQRLRRLAPRVTSVAAHAVPTPVEHRVSSSGGPVVSAAVSARASASSKIACKARRRRAA